MGGPRGVTIVALAAHHAPACVSVIASLPEWFGYEGALESIGHVAETAEGFVALERDVVIGFVTTSPIFDETLEITYLAVDKRARRGGVGRSLLAAVCEKASGLGASSVSLITLGPSSGSAPYAETVAFYRAMGFWRSKEIRNVEWGGAPSLVMTAPVDVLRRGTLGVVGDLDRDGMTR